MFCDVTESHVVASDSSVELLPAVVIRVASVQSCFLLVTDNIFFFLIRSFALVTQAGV